MVDPNALQPSAAIGTSWWWPPAVAVKRIPTGCADLVGSPRVGFDRPAVPQVAVGRPGIGCRRGTGLDSVTEEAAAHVGHDGGVALGSSVGDALSAWISCGQAAARAAEPSLPPCRCRRWRSYTVVSTIRRAALHSRDRIASAVAAIRPMAARSSPYVPIRSLPIVVFAPRGSTQVVMRVCSIVRW